MPRAFIQSFDSPVVFLSFLFFFFLVDCVFSFRKKVAIRGDRVLHGASSNKLMMKAADAAAAATEAPAAAAAHAASVAAGVEGPELSTSPAPGASSGAVGGGVHAGGFTSNDQIRVRS